MVTKEKLISDLKQLGIQSGDTLLIRGNLGKLGRLENREDLLNAFLEVVGEEGTLVTLSFSKSFPFYRVDKNYIFDIHKKSTSGALANLFLKHNKHVRSSHPTNSFVAIGKNANQIVTKHNETSLSYSPIKELIDLDAKLLNFGITRSSPGFTTVHYAQEELGLTKQSFFNGLLRVYYKNNDGETQLFKRNDRGGCSMGFDNFYKFYLEEKTLTIGLLGKSEVIMASAKELYKIEYLQISKNPSVHFCDNPLCISCRITWKYSLKDIPSFFVLKIIDLVRKVMK